MEIRSYGGEAAPKVTEGRTVEGYALVFNQRSVVMYDKDEKKLFHEVISPSAASDELLQRSDIRALVEHNAERLLARSNNGVGTLTLSFDEHGLKYRFDAPNTNDGSYALEMVGRGDIQGSSFAYRSISKGAVTWAKEANGMWLRTVNRFDVIADITITSRPAFTGTEVNVRSIQDLEPEQKENYQNQINQLRKRI